MIKNYRAFVSVLGPIIVIFIVLLTSPLGGGILNSIASFALINLILVLGLYIFVGNTGVISFGHAAFAAIGAYVGALTSMEGSTKAMLLPSLPEFLRELTLPLWGSLLLGSACAALFALIMGVPLMRLHGLAAGVGTLAMLIIVRNVIRSSKDLTGGAGTLNGVPLAADLPLISMVAIVVVLIAFGYQISRYGRLARSGREDRVAAVALGVSIFKSRLIAFVISGAVAGAGGVLYASYLGAISVDFFYLQLTFLLLAMLVIGGMTSLWGAVIGVLTVTAIQDGLGYLQGLPALSWLPSGVGFVGVGLVLLLVLLLRPQGITGGRELGDFSFRRNSSVS